MVYPRKSMKVYLALGAEKSRKSKFILQTNIANILYLIINTHDDFLILHHNHHPTCSFYTKISCFLELTFFNRCILVFFHYKHLCLFDHNRFERIVAHIISYFYIGRQPFNEMDPARKQEIIKMLSLDSVIRDYMRQPHRSSQRGISNIPRRTTPSKKMNITNYATMEPHNNQKSKRTCSASLITKKTIDNGLLNRNCTQKVQSTKKLQNPPRTLPNKNYQSAMIKGVCHETQPTTKNKIFMPKSKQPQKDKTHRIFKSTHQLEEKKQTLSTPSHNLQAQEDELLFKKTEPVPSNKMILKRFVKNRNLTHKNNEQLGVVLKGRYKLQKVIGRGLSGVVYKAKDVLADRHVAIKVIDPKNVEYQFIKQLDHPNLVVYYNSFLQNDKRYLVLEYFPLNLNQVIRRCRLQPTELKRIFREICSAVLYLHSLSLAHRDIKLDNIVANEDLSQIKFIDFGLCLDISEMNSKESRRFCGTTSYMAPEVVTGNCIDPKKADIWSLGIVLYALAVGRTPFKARVEEDIYNKIKNCKTVFPNNIEEKLKSLLGKMLEKKPEERPSIFQVLHHDWMTV